MLGCEGDLGVSGSVGNDDADAKWTGRRARAMVGAYR